MCVYIIYIKYVMYIIDLCSFLYDSNLLCSHITISQYFPSVKMGWRKKNVQPDIFLKPISEAEAVSDIPENENLLVTYQKMKPSISLFPVQCLAHWMTEPAKVLRKLIFEAVSFAKSLCLSKWVDSPTSINTSEVSLHVEGPLKEPD